ncbi:hypothetical protein BD779DRAFT_1517249 [Infundibulicybe gibba]|nr:hypothetical protein BD779DRAFT_1517249 [Infundibulicybe gibba]
MKWDSILGIMLFRGLKFCMWLCIYCDRKFKLSVSMYGNLRLFTMIQRDGVLYYCCIFALSLLNIVFATQKADFVFLFAELERVIHSVLTAHIIFHIRSGISDRNSRSELTDVGY